jgi:site-specific recombinase XerD
MNFLQAWQGFLLHAEAESLSRYTIRDYRRTIERFVQHRGNAPVTEITKRDIEEFMASLNGLSKKTKLNYHIGLSSLWTWLVKEEMVNVHIVRQVDAPRPEQPAIVPFSREDVLLLLASLDRSKPYTRHFQREPSTHRTPNALRNRAIIYTLLDTGLRASELCNLEIRDIDFRNREIKVREGKGGKSRMVYVSSKAAKFIWRYLSDRIGAADNSPVFAAQNELPLGSRGLELMLQRLGKRAGVRDVYPHRFRHTFAINYLRNKGDAYTLQRILGHSSMEMTKRYLQIANEDVAVRQHQASPVANWGI